MAMLLAIDVGNSQICFGLFDREKIKAQWRTESKRQRTADEYWFLLSGLMMQAGFSPDQIGYVIFSSVVPDITSTLEDMLTKQKIAPWQKVHADMDSGIQLVCDNPTEVGEDRIVNAVAAHKIYHKDMIVVDFGTATTFDFITEKGEYRGGIICPGLGISAEALFERAAKLPRVEFQKPKKVIGTNTIACMQSGLFYGYLGLIDGILSQIYRELGKELFTIATGGLAHILAPYSKFIREIDRELTLKGLFYLYRRNHKSLSE